MSSACQPQRVQGCRPDAEGNIYTRCVKCGRVFGPHPKDQDPVEVSNGNPPCPKADIVRHSVTLPSYLAMAKNFAEAWIIHIAKGREIVSFEDILRTFRICSACEHYSDLAGQCAICGCYINLLHGGQGLNMLEWANEQCPCDPPLWKKEDRTPIKPTAVGH